MLFPAVLSAIIEPRRLTIPLLLEMPPPVLPAELSVMVLEISVSVPLLLMPPPVKGAEFPETVLLVSVTFPLPPMKMPPELVLAVLSEIVLLMMLTTTLARLKMVPWLALLLEMLLSITVRTPAPEPWRIAPPSALAVLLVTVLLFKTRAP